MTLKLKQINKIYLFIGIGLMLLSFSCNEKKNLEQKLIGLYGLYEININGKSVMNECRSNTFGLEKDNICYLPSLRIDGNDILVIPKCKWKVEIKDGRNYLILSKSFFEGKYLIEFIEGTNKIVLTSDRIVMKGGKVL